MVRDIVETLNSRKQWTWIYAPEEPLYDPAELYGIDYHLQSSL